MPRSTVTTHPSSREVVFTRLLDSPIEAVWQAWSVPRHLHAWFGPDGFSVTTHEFDFRPGGVWRLTMHGPNGFDVPTVIEFREIVPPTRLSYRNSWQTADAPSIAFDAVLALEASGTRTWLSLHFTFDGAESLRIAAERYGILRGGEQTMDRLNGHLQGSA